MQTIKMVLNYLVFISIVAIGTILLVAFARGYTFDPGSGEVIRYGLVQIESKPTNAQVVINDELSGKDTPFRESYNEGRYTIKLQREGFINWQKTVDLIGGEVTSIAYPLLVPLENQYKNFENYPDETSLSLSPNQTYFMSVSDRKLTVLNLNSNNAQPESITIVPSEDGPLGELTGINWSNNEDIALLGFKNKSGTTYYLYDSLRKEIAPITAEIKSARIKGLIASTQNYIVLGEKNQLSLFNTSNNQKIVLSSDARNASWANGTIVWYDVPTKSLLSYRDGERVKIPTLRDMDSDTEILVSEQNGELNLAYRSNNELRIILSALNEPFERTVSDVDRLRSFSPDGRFALFESNGNLQTYDLKELRQRDTTQEVSTLKQVSWIDGFHLSALRGDEHIVFEFDGQNTMTIAESTNPLNTFISGNLSYGYSLQRDVDSGAARLLRVELAAAELL